MRLKPQRNIKSRAQAEAAMSKLNNIDMQLAAWELAEANDIAAVRDKHAERQKMEGRIGLEAEKALLVKELELWADTDAETWESKTMETPFGKIGFRTSTPAVVLIKKIARNFKEAIELLASRLPGYLRRVPEIDKESILKDAREEKLDATKLAKCGLKVDQKEEFWIETNASKDLELAAKKLKAA